MTSQHKDLTSQHKDLLNKSNILCGVTHTSFYLYTLKQKMITDNVLLVDASYPVYMQYTVFTSVAVILIIKTRIKKYLQMCIQAS